MGEGKPLIQEAGMKTVASYEGTTTSDGNAAGTTLIDSNLTQANDYWKNQTVLITSGANEGQSRDITAFSGGTITVHDAFDSKVTSGTDFYILPYAPSTAEVSDLMADVGDASASTLGSLYAILGDPAQTFLTMIGYEGATSLADKLTATRAGYLDELDFDLDGRLGAPAAASIAADIATVDTVVDGIATDLGDWSGYTNFADMVAALGIPDVAGKDLYTVLVTDRLDHATYGLSAIETLVDDLESRLTATRAGYLDELDFDLDGRLGAPAGASIAADIATIDANVDTLITRVPAEVAQKAHLVNGTGDITPPTDIGIWDVLGDGTVSINNIKTVIDETNAYLEAAGAIHDAVIGNATGADVATDVGTLLTRLTATRAGNLDELDFDLDARLGSPAAASIAADLATIDGNVDEIKADAVYSMTFWSDLQATVTIAAAAADLDFPDVTVADLPAGATITRVVGLLKYANREDTSGGANAINGANKTIRIKKSAGSWGTDDVVLIDVPDNTLATAASTKEGGDVIEGDNDVSSEVDGNATYNVRSEQTNRADAILVDGANLVLRDVQTALKVYFQV